MTISRERGLFPSFDQEIIDLARTSGVVISGVQGEGKDENGHKEDHGVKIIGHKGASKSTLENVCGNGYWNLDDETCKRT
jgi:hypothetical protein